MNGSNDFSTCGAGDILNDGGGTLMEDVAPLLTSTAPNSPMNISKGGSGGNNNEEDNKKEEKSSRSRISGIENFPNP
jgi:hypothetical protein